MEPTRGSILKGTWFARSPQPGSMLVDRRAASRGKCHCLVRHCREDQHLVLPQGTLSWSKGLGLRKVSFFRARKGTPLFCHRSCWGTMFGQDLILMKDGGGSASHTAQGLTRPSNEQGCPAVNLPCCVKMDTNPRRPLSKSPWGTNRYRVWFTMNFASQKHGIIYRQELLARNLQLGRDRLSGRDTRVSCWFLGSGRVIVRRNNWRSASQV